MPLPKKTLRVLANPWGHIHPELGPQAACPIDNGGRGGERLFVGADYCPERSEKSTDVEVKLGSAQFASGRGPRPVFKFSEEAVTVPKTPYYLDRLRDGDLVPADRDTVDAAGGELAVRFKSIDEARAAGIAKFEAEFGQGTFAEAFPDIAKALAPKPAQSARRAASNDSGGSQ